MVEAPAGNLAEYRRNTILAGLPDADLARMAPHLEEVDLPRGRVLEEPYATIHDVYFPIAGIASIMSVGPDGESVDTVMTGSEGMTGIAVFLGTTEVPTRTVVQLPFQGYRMRVERLRDELERGGQLVNLLQRYTQVVLVSMAQLILCNRAHSLEQRTARWLLQVDERVHSLSFDVTQEFLAEMVGAQRPSLSVIIGQFKAAGIIRSSRGRIEVGDAEGLLARSCGCIEIMHREEARLRETAEAYNLTAASR